MRILSALLFAALLSGCSTTRPAAIHVDPEIQSQTKSARAAYDAGIYDRAARFYTLALNRARALDDAGEIARNAYNAAACLLRADEAAAAEPLLVEARREFAAAGLDLNRVILLQARAAKALGHPGQTARFVAEALETSTNISDRVDALVLKADEALSRGDTESADATVRAARALIGASGNDALTAAVSGASARVLAKSGRHGEAAEDYDRQAAAYRATAVWRDMAAALGFAADEWLAAGDSGKAADRYYRSARSYWGGGDSVAALRQIEKAVGAAEKGGSEPLREQIAALFRQMKAAEGSAGE